MGAAGGELTLKVVEGRLQDVGRGLARLDPIDISRLSLPVGGVVQIAEQLTCNLFSKCGLL